LLGERAEEAVARRRGGPKTTVAVWLAAQQTGERWPAPEGGQLQEMRRLKV
jgi:hypothetical protein